MERIIKFRVWDLSFKKFLENTEALAITLKGELQENHYWYDDTPDYMDIDQWTDSRKNVVIQQFTGLKDKNGKEIYEGDILKTVSTHGPSINFPNGNIEEKILEVKWDKYGTNLHFYFTEQMGVVGNIFENPELLKKNE